MAPSDAYKSLETLVALWHSRSDTSFLFFLFPLMDFLYFFIDIYMYYRVKFMDSQFVLKKIEEENLFTRH